VDQRELVERATRGDHDAFAALARAAGNRLLGASCLILDDLELARDATQEGLIRAWRDLPSLRDPNRFDAWIHRLTVNACLDILRRRKRRAVEIDIDGFERSGDGDHAAAIVDRDAVEVALRRLDPSLRVIVVLHYFSGLPLPEVARAVGIPLGTAKSRLHRALAGMRVTLGDGSGGLDPIQEGQPA
jgi:RNA polymerase sigma-70 factor (ECF subfamily)